MLQKVKVLSLLIFLAGAGCKTTQKPLAETAKPAQVQVLATIHKFHATNPDYNYARVTELIRKFNPDIIAVEIRPEDLKEDSAYLAQFYPLEMRQVLLDFPNEKVRGVDWYGDEMAGKKLPADVFKTENTELGKIKKLEREMNRDTVLLPRLMPIVAIGKQQAALAANSSPASLNNGQYDSLTVNFYQVLEAAVKGTPYETYTRFNRRRDEIITRNIVDLAIENPGKRIIVLLGANHRDRAVKALQNLPAEKVNLVPVVD